MEVPGLSLARSSLDSTSAFPGGCRASVAHWRRPLGDSWSWAHIWLVCVAMIPSVNGEIGPPVVVRITQDLARNACPASARDGTQYVK